MAVVINEEKKTGNSSLAFIISMQDQKLRKTHAFELNKKNHCPKCNMVMTTLKKCPMEC